MGGPINIYTDITYFLTQPFANDSLKQAFLAFILIVPVIKLLDFLYRYLMGDTRSYGEELMSITGMEELGMACAFMKERIA